MCILQVSFVFTNQVDGKLVPVESVARSAPHQLNGIAAHGDKWGKPILLVNPENNPYLARI